MIETKHAYWPVLLICIFSFIALQGNAQVADNTAHKTLTPLQTPKPITIDGSLTEAAWKNPPINRPFKTFSPNYGDPATEKTQVWAAYDTKNLYFAFKCFDSQPHKIKTSIAQRDKITRDDYVGLYLDAAHNKQTHYEFYVNPNGIQADAVKSAVSVSGADYAADFVWQSAGKITDDGYVVEIRIPLESLRYKSGKDVKMGVIFTRQISRLGTKAAWPEIRAGQTTFNFMGTLQYKSLKQSLKLEILPNFTYSHNAQRINPVDWDKTNDTNIGVGIKYGITSAITAQATFNPDFSQVESDAFQVEVNQRFPIFYREKRPFFLESKEVFDFGVVKWGLMPAAVHTRTIVDPGWAVKLSGAAGKLNFALLGANDRSAGYAWDIGQNPDQGKSALVGIFRAKYSLGSDNSIGILYSGRHFAGRRNDVAGADLKYRLSKSLRAGVSYLHGTTRTEKKGPMQNGDSVNAMLQYNTARVFGLMAYEYYGRDFTMDSAFLSRGALNRLLIGGGPGFNMKIKKLPWLKRIMPYAYYILTHDLETKLDDETYIFGINLSFAPMGMFNFEYVLEDEAWAGTVFPKKNITAEGLIQLFKWLHLNANLIAGESIYYDFTHPFLGNALNFTVGATIQPGIKLNIGLVYSHSHLNRQGALLPGTSRNVYKVNIYNLRATYQFNKYFFLRGILRYNSYRQKLMTDALASFTLIPGTVVHLGYGSLHEKKHWQNSYWWPGGDRFHQMRRGLFFKASYLWRFN